MSKKKSTYKVNQRVNTSILTQRRVFFPFPAEAPIVGDFWTQGVLLASPLTSFIHFSIGGFMHPQAEERRRDKNLDLVGWLQPPALAVLLL